MKVVSAEDVKVGDIIEPPMESIAKGMDAILALRTAPKGAPLRFKVLQAAEMGIHRAFRVKPRSPSKEIEMWMPLFARVRVLSEPDEIEACWHLF